jgi:hypothetical protein
LTAPSNPQCGTGPISSATRSARRCPGAWNVIRRHNPSR